LELEVTTALRRAVQLRGAAPQTLAVFHWDGGKVQCEWHDDAYRRQVLEIGIVAPGERSLLKPADGEAFWKALEVAYARSTFVYVEDVEG
jgi:hypothetical protein